MRRTLLATLAVLLLASLAGGKTGERHTPVQKLVQAELVVVGKVTAIEKDLAEVAGLDGRKRRYRVAVARVETSISGGAKVGRVKIGFPPAGPGDKQQLAEGVKGLFYLRKRQDGFYVLDGERYSYRSTDGGYRAEVELATSVAAVLAAPLKSLKAAGAADRFFAANVLVNRYRSREWCPPKSRVVVEDVPAEENRLILRALTEAPWKGGANLDSPFGVVQLLGMPKGAILPPELKPGQDYAEEYQILFAKWLAGPGKDFRIRRYVVKDK